MILDWYIPLLSLDWYIPLLSSFFFIWSLFTQVMLDWSYNYHANDMYQQVAPIEISVKNKPTNKKTPHLICSQQTTIHTLVSVSMRTHHMQNSIKLLDRLWRGSVPWCIMGLFSQSQIKLSVPTLTVFWQPLCAIACVIICVHEPPVPHLTPPNPWNKWMSK